MSADHKKRYELEKSTPVTIVNAVEYVLASVVVRTILGKTTGNVSIMAVDSGMGLTEKTSAFDTYVQVIDGKADIIIKGVPFVLAAGQSIVIPAHAPYSFWPAERFKLMVTVIKYGYDQVAL